MQNHRHHDSRILLRSSHGLAVLPPTTAELLGQPTCERARDSELTYVTVNILKDGTVPRSSRGTPSTIGEFGGKSDRHRGSARQEVTIKSTAKTKVLDDSQ
mgnify:CR=1 FL=1